ncbi:MAG: MerR family DNA-binding protein [Paracoccaceae bacterium]|nr:MerR family DNA-binding protein [Paracoccaceae bacterium]
MRIGKLAAEAGVGVETVRFYESKDLIAQPIRPTGGGYRDYPVSVLDRIRFIRSAQQLGFSLKEVKDLLALDSDLQTQCGDVRGRAETKLREVEKKIRGLTRMRVALVRLIDHCPGDGPARRCSILNELRASDPPHARP